MSYIIKQKELGSPTYYFVYTRLPMSYIIKQKELGSPTYYFVYTTDSQ
jgi:hypothetical protein